MMGPAPAGLAVPFDRRVFSDRVSAGVQGGMEVPIMRFGRGQCRFPAEPLGPSGCSTTVHEAVVLQTSDTPPAAISHNSRPRAGRFRDRSLANTGPGTMTIICLCRWPILTGTSPVAMPGGRGTVLFAGEAIAPTAGRVESRFS